MSPEFEAIIDHPIQSGWLLHGRDIYDDPAHVDAIKRRFEGTNENIALLLSKIALAAAITDAERMRHESLSRSELGLYGMADLDIYQKLAGKPKHVGRFINWFSGVAYSSLVHEEKRSDLKEIGLDLGGMRQAGDWSGTKPIDSMAETIKEAVEAANPAAIVEVIKRGKHLKKSYQAEPLDHYEGGRYNPNFAYARVTRKRNAANILIPGHFPMRVWKVSHAVIAINLLDESDIKVIRQAYKDPKDLAVNILKDSTPAGVMGRAFEADINDPERAVVDTETPVRRSTPLSAHYHVTMERLAA